MWSSQISGIAIFFAIGIATYLLAKAKPKARTDAGIEVRPTLLIPAVGFLCFAMAVFCLYGFITSGVLLPLGLAIGFALGGAFLTNMLRSVFAVFNDEIGITGPNSTLLAPQRLSIAWTDVSRIAASWTGSLFIEATDGRRIYFGTTYAGYAHLVEEIYRHRPDLRPSVRS